MAQATVEIRRRYEFPPERVFDAWLNKSMLEKWRFRTVEPHSAQLEMDVRVGGGYWFGQWVWGEELVERGSYLEIERPRRLVIEESMPGSGHGAGCLTVEFEPRPNGCELKLTVSSPDDESSQFALRYGWAVTLEELAAALDADASSVDTDLGSDLPLAKIMRHIAATPERVFDAWLDPELLGRWMFGPAVRDEEVIRLQVNPVPGGTFSFLVRRENGEIDHVGEYLSISRPNHLSFTWGVRQQGPVQFSRIVVELKPVETGCNMTITHVMHEDWAAFTEQATAAWTHMSAMLAKCLEGDAPPTSW